MDNKYIKSLLYIYTFIVIAISIFISFGVVKNSERVVLAACSTEELNVCTQNAIQWCVNNIPAGNPAERQSCVDSAYNNCVATCIPQAPNPTPNPNPDQSLSYDCDTNAYIFELCPKEYQNRWFGRTSNQTCIQRAVELGCYNNGPEIGVKDPNLCTSNLWNLYVCDAPNACSTYGSGCSQRFIGQYPNDEIEAELNKIDACTVRQADCVDTAGANLIFKSRISCATNCSTANPPVVTPNPQPPVGNPEIPVVIPPADVPPEEEPIYVQCNDTCNNSNRICPSNLSCIPVDGVNRCRLPSNPTSPTCQPPLIVTNPNYTIDKVLEGRYEYIVGEIATFRVRIVNTGDTTLTNVKFKDVYSTTFLTFSGGSARKSNGTTIDNIVPHLTRNSNGILEIENILSSSVFGSLAPNGYIDVTLKFVTKAPINETCNFAYIDSPDLPEINDNACLGAKNINTDI